MGFGDFMKNLYHKTVNAASGTINAVESFVPKAGATIFNSLKSGVNTIVSEPKQAISALSSGVTTAYNNAQHNIDTILNTPKEIITGLESTASNIIPQVASSLSLPLIIGAVGIGAIALSVLRK